jgi:hypothetical protein
VLVSSKLFFLLNFVGAKYVIILLHFIFIHHGYDVLAPFLFIFKFFIIFPPLLCKCLLLLTDVLSFFLCVNRKIMMINLILLHLFWCLVKKKIVLYFADACISCNILYLYCILFKCTYLIYLPLKETLSGRKHVLKT